MRPSLKRFLAYAGGFLAIGIARWIGQCFGSPDIDQILYHLHYSEGAAVHMGEVFMATLLVEGIGAPLVLAALATALHGLLAGHWPQRRPHLRAGPVLAVLAGLAALLHQFSAFAYVAAQFGPDHFAEQYVDPRQVKLQDAEHPRNLLLVYVESLEKDYGDPALFGRDLLAPLHKLGAQGFAAYHQAPGTNWTIAAMVGTQCGVPLKVISGYAMKRDGNERVFLPRATCLGDLLQARGYRNVFLGGAPLSFAGKGAFLHDHGYTETWGREEWEQAGVSHRELSEWGLYDSALYQRALDRLDALHREGKPFNLTVLTLDTHPPVGFPSPECHTGREPVFQDIVACTGRQLAGFITEVQRRGYLKDTVLVVLGDHLSMPNPVITTLERSGDRQMFNLVMGDNLPPLHKQPVVTFDLYPTLAELLGMRVEGSRLGLGYSAVSAQLPPAHVPPPLAALNGSSAYKNLWEP
jgi:phosphoglycerol transferase